MANTETYQAILACERWRDAIGLSPRDMPRLTQDMGRIIEIIKAQSEETKRLKISNAALREDRQIRRPRITQGSLIPAAADIRTKAQAIAEAAGYGAIDVYRYQVGTVRWYRAGSRYEGRGEYIGTYDEGCDWRQIGGDLQA